jgi:hypothetical protein
MEFEQLEESQPRIPHPAKLTCKNEGKIKTFSDKETLKGFALVNLCCKKCKRRLG